MSCCVEGCEKTSTVDVNLFQFPTSRLLRKRWLDAIKPVSSVDMDAVICSRHFLAGDYADEAKTNLKSKVVPSIFGDQGIPEVTTDPLQIVDNGIEINTRRSHKGNENNKDNELNKGECGNSESSDSEFTKKPQVKRRRRSKRGDKRSRNCDKNKKGAGDESNDEVNKKQYNVAISSPSVEKSDDTVTKSNDNVDKTSNNDESDDKVDKSDGLGSTKDENKRDDINKNIKDDALNIEKSGNSDSSDAETRRKSQVKRRRRSKRVDTRSSKADEKKKYSGSDESNDEGDKTPNVARNSKESDDTVNKNINEIDKNDGKVDKSDDTVAKSSENVDKNDVKDVVDNCNEKPKRVKKKIVPYRKVGTPALNRVFRNNGREMSEDSSSQDSVNSSLPPDSKEDIEDIIANYQIENKKTERQIAAMIPEDPVFEEEVTMEADALTGLGVEIAPVFIELSVGQDKTATEPTNDCLMVLESVQCDVDPALLLAAREEDEECLEQIDLDDDNDEVSITGTVPAKAPKRARPPVDPISLLTSSDEDDVILQEPKIDTLSVSDETDEDDMPLTRLIQQDTKQKKTPKKKGDKKKGKKEKLNEILCGKPNYFCMHCSKVVNTRHALKQHVATHLETYGDDSPRVTKVYQICKECGFTTSSKSQLDRHQRRHTNEKKFRCPLCSYKSKYNMSLMYHLKTHDFDPHMCHCGACGLELDDNQALVEHQKTCYAVEEEFACGKCGHTAKTKRQLKAHKREVHRQK